ncbi:hypothetical protein [Herbaspirillum sp. NPDC101397]|uniref:hypothetical protein n=1 Tax=Herbaspirillum sp. NPDC101397 TaxID=3364006 RepID=UPI00383BA195
MDWLDATTAALAIIAVPLALRYSFRTNKDSGAETAACDCAAATKTKAAESVNRQDFPQKEEPTQERQPDSLSSSRR